MKGTITVTFSAGEATKLLSQNISASVTTKILKAMRANTEVTPIGRRASAVAKKTPAPKKLKSAEAEEARQAQA